MRSFILFIFSLAPIIAIASGPLFIGSPSKLPVRYNNPTINFNFDNDSDMILTGTEALVMDAFNLWNGVTTSRINLSQGFYTSVNVDHTNYSTFIPDEGNPSPARDGLNPVIYDADGAITDDFFGLGASCDIAGFAASAYLEGGWAYTEGFAVINGKNLSLCGKQSLSDTIITLVIAHEIGHFIGLDHTLVDINEDISTACYYDPKQPSEYPLMYPFVCRVSESLHQDDIISVSTLYPSADINQQFGQINGKFLNTDGTAILGANIWVQNTATLKAYSIVSDYLTGRTGFFSLYLPPGDYTLHANSIDEDFNGASGVGPYTEDPVNGASFKAPHPIAPISFEGDTPGSDERLTVSIGEATNVTFKLDGTGTSTTGNKIFIPTLQTPSSGNDGGGSLAPMSLILLMFIIYLRSFRHKTIH